MKSELVWSITLLILLSMNGEIVSMSELENVLTFWFLLQAAEKRNNWIKCQPKCQKREQNVFFWVLFRLSNNTTLGNNAIFRWCWFPQVVQKQTLGEVGNCIMTWCPIVSGIIYQKILISDNYSSYNWKCSRCFLRHSVVNFVCVSEQNFRLAIS